MADRNDEEILRAILEKGSDKAKQQAAAAIAQQPPTPADPPVVKQQKKKRKGLAKVAGALGKQKFYYGPGGTIVDKDGVPAPPLIADMLRSKDQMVERVRENIVQPSTRSQPNLNAVNSELNRIVSSSGALARTHDSLVRKIPQAFGQIDLAIRKIVDNHHAIVQSLIKQNEELQDKVIESLTGVKAPTRAAGAVTKPKRGSAARAVGASRAASGTKLRNTLRRKEVLERRDRIMAVREERNKSMIKRMAVGGALVGGAAAAIASMVTKPSTPTTGAGGGTPPATPGPTGNEPSPDAQRSNVPGMVELVSPISKKKYVVAQQYAANFKGFVDELENSGYKIKSIGGYANRNIAGTGQKSYHSLGVAIDINPSTNPHTFPPKGLVTDMPSNVAAMAAKYGLGWGGNWRSSKDAMHFSMAAGEGGSVRIDRSGVAPLPGAPAAPAPAAGETTGAPAAAAPAAPPPGVPQAAMEPSPGTPGAPTRQSGGAPSIREISQYIVSKAAEMGVNPNLALGIAAYEGLNRNTIGHPTFGNRDAKGYSFGPYQLYSASPDPTKIAPGGMAMEFLQKYKEPPNVSNWRKQVDFSLELMKRRGPAGLERGPWYAVRDRGGVANISTLGSQFARQQGVSPGAIAPEAAPAAPSAPSAPGAAPTAPSGAPAAAPAAPEGVPPAAMAPSPGTANAPAAPTAQAATSEKPSNVNVGRNADLSKVDPDLLKRLYGAAKEYGQPVSINSAYRSDEYQAQLWVRANVFREPGIYSPARPAQTVTISYKGQQHTVRGSGRGSSHGRGNAIDISPGPALDPFLRKYGLHRPHASFDPPHVEKIGGSSYAASSGAPTAAPGAVPPTVQQGRTVAAGSTAQAMEENMNAGAGRVVVMNNNRVVSQTRTVVRGGSVPMDRPGTRDVNPLDIVAGVAAGYAFGKALRLF